MDWRAGRVEPGPESLGWAQGDVLRLTSGCISEGSKARATRRRNRTSSNEQNEVRIRSGDESRGHVDA